MKTKNLPVSLPLGLGLLIQALLAQRPANGRGANRPDTAPVGDPEECPCFVEGECPGGQLGSPEDCPYALDGSCPDGQADPGVWRNPDGTPQRDGAGGRGQPANPDGPVDRAPSPHLRVRGSGRAWGGARAPRLPQGRRGGGGVASWSEY